MCASRCVLRVRRHSKHRSWPPSSATLRFSAATSLGSLRSDVLSQFDEWWTHGILITTSPKSSQSSTVIEFERIEIWISLTTWGVQNWQFGAIILIGCYASWRNKYVITTLSI